MANKVIIAVACNDTMKSKTCLSLVTALRHVDFDYDMIMRQGCDLIGSRTGLVRMAKDMKDATHILFLDHDMFLNPTWNEDIQRMESPITRLLSWNKDIIGAPYNFRSIPLKSTASPIGEVLEHEPYKCHVVATGFLLIKLSVFEKMPEPWFQFGRDAQGELVYGEDAYFCQQAIKAGFDVWADPTIHINHLGEFSY